MTSNTKRTGIIESLEEHWYRIEIDGEIYEVPHHLVDSNAKLNDVVEWDGVRWSRNAEETAKRSQDIQDLVDEVWEEE